MHSPDRPGEASVRAALWLVIELIEELQDQFPHAWDSDVLHQARAACYDVLFVVRKSGVRGLPSPDPAA